MENSRTGRLRYIYSTLSIYLARVELVYKDAYALKDLYPQSLRV